MNIAQFRQKYPMYNDMSDKELSDKLYNKYYSDMPRAEFDKRFGYQQPSFMQRLGKGIEGSSGTFAGAADKAVLDALNLPSDAANWLASKVGVGKPFENITDVPTDLINLVSRGIGHPLNWRSPTQIADQSIDFQHHPIAGLAGSIAGTIPAFMATGGLGEGSAIENIVDGSQSISPALSEMLQQGKNIAQQAVPFTQASRAAKAAGTAKGLERLGRLSAQSALVGGLTAPTGERASGAEFGGAAGALAPAGAKALNIALRPVVGMMAADFPKIFAKKMADYIHPDFNHTYGTSYLDKGAADLKSLHDISKENVSSLYDSAKMAAQDSDKAISKNTEAQKSVKDILSKNPADKFLAETKEDLADKYDLLPEEKEQYLGRLVEKFSKNKPSNLSDLISQRKALSKIVPRGKDNATIGAERKFLGKYRTFLDNKINELSNNVENVTELKTAVNRYQKANKAFSQHASTYRELPKASLGDMMVTNANLVRALNSNSTPSAALIEKNFIPKSRSGIEIKRLGKMLGNQDYANDLVKTSLFDKYIRNNLAKPGMLAQYEKLPAQHQNMLFSPSQNAIIRAASRLKQEGLGRQVLRGVGHYGTAGALGGLAGELMGRGWAPGAVAGLALEAGGDALGTALTRRMLNQENLAQMENLIDRHLLNPDKAIKALVKLAVGTHDFVKPSQASRAAIGTRNMVENQSG